MYISTYIFEFAIQPRYLCHSNDNCKFDEINIWFFSFFTEASNLKASPFLRMPMSFLCYTLCIWIPKFGTNPRSFDLNDSSTKITLPFTSQSILCHSALVNVCVWVINSPKKSSSYSSAPFFTVSTSKIPRAVKNRAYAASAPQR